METHIANAQTKEYAALYERPVPFDFVADESGAIKSRRPNADSTATAIITCKTHISPTNALPTSFGSAKSGEIRTKLSNVGVNGPIKRVWAKVTLTPSASAVGFYSLCVDDVYYRFGQGVRTLERSAFSNFAESFSDMNDEDVYTKGLAMGVIADGTWAGATLAAEAQVLIDITGPLRGKAITPSLLQDEIEVVFKCATLASFMDTATQTCSIQNIQVVVEWEALPADMMAKIAEAYKGGVEWTFLQAPARSIETVSGTTEKNLDLDESHRCPFFLTLIRDESDDVQENAVDFSAMTKYKIVDASGQTLFQTNGSEYVYAGEHWIKMSEMFNGKMLKAKNILWLPAGCDNINEAIQQQSYQPGYKFQMNERLYITSSDSNADQLLIYPYYWCKIGVKGGKFTTIEEL